MENLTEEAPTARMIVDAIPVGREQELEYIFIGDEMVFITASKDPYEITEGVTVFEFRTEDRDDFDIALIRFEPGASTPMQRINAHRADRLIVDISLTGKLEATLISPDKIQYEFLLGPNNYLMSNAGHTMQIKNPNEDGYHYVLELCNPPFNYSDERIDSGSDTITEL